MSTFADVINDCYDFLYSHGGVRDSWTSLSGAIAAGDTQLMVADANQIKAGFMEIDDELLQISGGNASGLVTVFPWGRGTRGTVAASHANNAKVTVNPQIARTQIKRMIAESVTALYPTLFKIGVDQTNTWSPVVIGYPLPAETTGVAEVSFQVIGPYLAWQRVDRFRFVPEADTTAFPTGKAVELYGPAFPGRVLKVVYRANFGTFVNETDTLESIGLRSEWRDILRLDACARLVTSLDAGRLQLTSIEAAGRAEGQVQPLQAVQVARALKLQYAERVANERRRLLIDYPNLQQRQM